MGCQRHWGNGDGPQISPTLYSVNSSYIYCWNKSICALKGSEPYLHRKIRCISQRIQAPAQVTFFFFPFAFSRSPTTVPGNQFHGFSANWEVDSSVKIKSPDIELGILWLSLTSPSLRNKKYFCNSWFIFLSTWFLMAGLAFILQLTGGKKKKASIHSLDWWLRALVLVERTGMAQVVIQLLLWYIKDRFFDRRSQQAEWSYARHAAHT